MQRIRRLAGSALPYALSIAVAKGLSLLLMPWVARHLPPEDYGRIEMIASTLEFLGLLLAFGLGDMLFRFSSGESDEGERHRRAAAIAGLSIGLALVCAVTLQLLAPLIRDVVRVPIGEGALRLALLGVSVGGMIELPLAWLRARNRPFVYLGFAAARAALQFAAIAWLVSIDPHAESVIVGSSAVELLLAAALLVLQFRDTGVRFTRQSLRWLHGYSLPLLVGGLATFVLGTCDRWLLVGQIPTSELGLYGVAAKLALAAALVSQPFGLWWYARRLAVLGEPGGLARSADAVALGFAVLAIGATAVCLAGPAFVRLLLPPAYLPAAGWIPWLVLAGVLNETASLINVGCYARRTTWLVAVVNALGAAVAAVGYIAFIPAMGVDGAILATVLAHAARIAGFLIAGQRVAPIPYRSGRMLGLAAAGATAVWLGSKLGEPALLGLAAVGVPALLGLLALVLGMAKWDASRPIAAR